MDDNCGDWVESCISSSFAAASLLCLFLNVFHSLRKKNESRFFTLHDAYVTCAIMVILYTH